MFKAGVNTTLWQWIGTAITNFADLATDIFNRPFYMNLIGIFGAFLVLIMLLKFFRERG